MITRRDFAAFMGAGMTAAAGLVLPGCGGGRNEQPADEATSDAAQAEATKDADAAATPDETPTENAGAIVVYFSHAGENYGVGVVEEGNTAVLAKIIAKKTGAELFEIVPAEAYPEGYDDCCDVALAEQNEGARPAYVGDIDLAGYQTVYLGYPIWWGDLPMCVYTFLEAHDWTSKDIRPFCTHAGSGLAGTPDNIAQACAGATVGEALAMAGTTAQNSRDEAAADAAAWLGM